jgi:hypothetical protein
MSWQGAGAQVSAASEKLFEGNDRNRCIDVKPKKIEKAGNYLMTVECIM